MWSNKPNTGCKLHIYIYFFVCLFVCLFFLFLFSLLLVVGLLLQYRAHSPLVVGYMALSRSIRSSLKRMGREFPLRLRGNEPY